MKHIFIFFACVCAAPTSRGAWTIVMFIALEAYFLIDKHEKEHK